MYGCCRASSTEILLEASITSIFDNKSLAWLAAKIKFSVQITAIYRTHNTVFQSFKEKGQSNQVLIKCLCDPYIIRGLVEWSIWWQKTLKRTTVKKGVKCVSLSIFSIQCPLEWHPYVKQLRWQCSLVSNSSRQAPTAPFCHMLLDTENTMTPLSRWPLEPVSHWSNYRVPMYYEHKSLILIHKEQRSALPTQLLLQPPPPFL